MSELIDVLLAESELADDSLLRDLLVELEREATAVAPMPSAGLSELMNPRRTIPGHAHDRGTRRRPSFAGRGAVITGVVVLGALGLGAGAAAASPDVRSAIGAGVAAIAHLFHAPATADAPAPTEAATESPEPSAAVTPSPSDIPSDAPGTSNGGAAAGTGSDGSDASGEQGSDPSNSGQEGSDDSNSGNDSGTGSGDTHGNGKGNQSGHGNGKGQGNGGPAPTP